MIRYLARRLISGLVTLFLFVSLVFVGTQVVLPGDFVSQYALFLSTSESEEMRQTLPATLLVYLFALKLNLLPANATWGMRRLRRPGLGDHRHPGGSAIGLLSWLGGWGIRPPGGVALLAPAQLVMVVIGFMLDVQPLEFGLLYGISAGLGTVGVVLRSHALSVMSRPFIGPLGLSRAQLNWGMMIYDASTYMGINESIPWNVLLASASAISLFAAAFYLVAGGLHDVADPRQRK